MLTVRFLINLTNFSLKCETSHHAFKPHFDCHNIMMNRKVLCLFYIRLTTTDYHVLTRTQLLFFKSKIFETQSIILSDIREFRLENNRGKI